MQILVSLVRRRSHDRGVTAWSWDLRLSEGRIRWAVNMSGWDTLKHENARWLDGLLAYRVLSHLCRCRHPAN